MQFAGFATVAKPRNVRSKFIRRLISETMKIISAFILLTLFSCKQSETDNKQTVEFDRVDSLYLKSFGAKESKYSLLFFGGNYFDTKLEVENCKVIEAEDSTETLKVGPFAKIYRIDNSCDIKIKDFKRKVNLEIKRDSIKLYKFIYVDRDFENDSLKITYTKNHIPVK